MERPYTHQEMDTMMPAFMEDLMRSSILLFGILLLGTSRLPGHMQELTSIEVAIEQLSENLYLDTTLIPDGFDRSTLIRLYDFLKEHVIADCRSPYPEQVNCLPVIVRYVPFTEEGQFPATTQGYAGWCDVVRVECPTLLEGTCRVSMSEPRPGWALAFLALVAIPDNPDYLAQLWGFTGHELAHSVGAIDGPRHPFYEDDKLLAPVEPVSDTYYWFGIAGVFEPGWQGIIWDAWHDSCTDSLCEALRHEVFQIG
jgi:hypothetical protein